MFKRELMGMAVVGIVVRNNDSEWGGVGGEASDDLLYIAHFLFRTSCCLALQQVQLFTWQVRVLSFL